MKKLLLVVTLSFVGSTAILCPLEGNHAAAFAQSKEKKKADKKDPPGPPVVRPKGKEDRPKEPPPKKDKKP